VARVFRIQNSIFLLHVKVEGGERKIRFWVSQFMEGEEHEARLTSDIVSRIQLAAFNRAIVVSQAKGLRD
jgi:hypothetical protein